MNEGSAPHVLEALPQDVWDTLANEKGSVLVDVRSAAEWAFVGGPDLTQLGKDTVQAEWSTFPGMIPNDNFAQEVLDALGGTAPSHVFFLCRSGARSLSAARTLAQVFAEQGKQVTCVNVQEGFEGDLNAQRHRGDISGWKARNLPWKQS